MKNKPDPMEFRIPASDTKGHTARQWFRLIPTMSRQIDQTVQAKIFPYRTKGDLIRHAVHRHMEYLSDLEPIVSTTGQVDAMLEIMRDEEMNNDFALVFTKMNERVNQHLSEGSRKEAARLVMIIQSHITKMPSGFWKDRYCKEMKKKFGDLIENTPKYKIGSTEGGQNE